jgi:hypothetical protein
MWRRPLPIISQKQAVEKESLGRPHIPLIHLKDKKKKDGAAAFFWVSPVFKDLLSSGLPSYANNWTRQPCSKLSARS